MLYSVIVPVFHRVEPAALGYLVHKELKEPGHHLAPSLHPVSESFDSLEGGRALFPLEILGKVLHALDPLGGIL
jgi:hypothetical protein